MPYVRQTSFLGGELSPLLWGRTDLPVFAHGLRTCRNFFVTRHGAAVSRPGTTHVAQTREAYDAGWSPLPVRLIPFFYTEAQSYVLELGDKYLRVYSAGARVGTVELVTPYAAADLARLQWAQVGDVLVLTHPSYTPQVLTRVAHTSWTLAAISVAAPPFDQSAANPGAGGPLYLRKPLPTADDTHPARQWTWCATLLFRRTDGSVYETTPHKVALMTSASGIDTEAVADQVALYPDKPVTLKLTAVSTYGFAVAPVGFRIYRGRGGMFGWVGDAEYGGGAPTWVDNAQTPDYARVPPSGRASLEIYDASGTLTRTEKPAAVAYFQERRCYGGTNERPAWLFASGVGEYGNFDERAGTPGRLVHLADEPLSFELACRRRESIRGMAGLARLLIFTDASVWALSGHLGEPLSYDSVDARVVESIGATYLSPLVIGEAALYARAKGTGVRAVVPGDMLSGYAGVDLSAAAQHLFLAAGGAVVDWTYAEDPWGLVWVVRGDGVLLSLTYDAQAQAVAWARHDTDGYVRAVCAVPEGTEDAVYLVVERTDTSGRAGIQTSLFIERMTSRVRSGGLDDDVCLDAAARLQLAVPGVTLPGLDWLEGESVYVTSAGNPPYGPFVVVNGQVTLPEVPAANFGAQWVGYAGLPFTPELETLGIASTDARLRQKTVVSVGLEVSQSKGLWVGQDFAHLVEWRQRQVADSYGAIGAAAEVLKVAVKGKWDVEARAALRQTLPLPVTVLGVTRELDVGG